LRTLTKAFTIEGKSTQFIRYIYSPTQTPIMSTCINFERHFTTVHPLHLPTSQQICYPSTNSERAEYI